ncbi:MAG: histidinol-phosphate transaminase [Gammaproteobacteria bacterium]
MSMLSRMRADLRDFTLYTAGDGDDAFIRLHANESPFRAACDTTARGQHRYPLGRHSELTNRLAGLYRVEPAQLLVTRGSDDGIDLLIRTFCTAGSDNIVCTTPGFGMYGALARLQGCESLEFPLHGHEDFALNMERYVAAATASTKIVFVCSPNNPSGASVGLEDIALACRRLANQALVVVDEAYGEFSATPAAATLIGDFDNLIVLRTLSKAYGLASARIGAVLGDAAIIDALDRLLTPFPLPSACVDDALRVTEPSQRATLLGQWQLLVSERQRMRHCLGDLPCIKQVWPSEANFLLTRTTTPAALVDHCRARGLLVRLIQGVESPFVRITMGTVEQNNKLLKTLEAFVT